MTRVEPPKSKLAFAGGVLGIISVVFIAFAYPIAIPLNSEIFLVGSMGLGMLASLLAIVFSAMAKLRGGWGMTGLVTGIVSMTVVFCWGICIMSGMLDI